LYFPGAAVKSFIEETSLLNAHKDCFLNLADANKVVLHPNSRSTTEQHKPQGFVIQFIRSTVRDSPSSFLSDFIGS